MKSTTMMMDWDDVATQRRTRDSLFHPLTFLDHFAVDDRGSNRAFL